MRSITTSCTMRNGLVWLAAAAAIALCGESAEGQTLAYSFEAPPVNPDGFGPNGGGVTVSQDTIGTTNGLSSLQVDVVQGATFVGALTGVVHPSIGDPPGADYILFDMTIDAGQEFTGGFAVVGVTIFGASQPDFPGGQQFGLQAQFADFEHIGGKVAGTYNDVRIDLDSATHPLTFAGGQSFNEIFGTVGSGANDLVPTGFQLFFNKSNDQALTVYVDNVRVGQIPEPTTCALIGLAAIAMVGIRQRRGR
jgi:hypothetical protein